MTTKESAFISDLTVAELWSVCKFTVGLFAGFAVAFGLPGILAEWGSGASADYLGFADGRWPTWTFYAAAGVVALFWPGFVGLLLSDLGKRVVDFAAAWETTVFLTRLFWLICILVLALIGIEFPWIAYGIVFLAVSFIEGVYHVRGRREKGAGKTGGI